MNKFLIVLIVAVLLAGGGYYYFTSLDRTLNKIEEFAAEGFVAHLEISALLDGKALLTTQNDTLFATAYATEHDIEEHLLNLGNRVQKQHILMTDNRPARFIGMHSAIEGWLNDMWQAAEKMAATSSVAERKRIWSGITDFPPPFSTNLSVDDVVRIMETKVNEVIRLKEAGDNAIENNNRQGMLQVAAALRVQKYYLDYHLLQYEGECPNVGLCYPELNGTLPPMFVAAGGYAYSAPDAVADWNKSWTANELVIGGGGAPIAGTDVLTGTGITIPPPDTFNVGRRAGTFFGDCVARGGVIGGTGGIKEGLPTTEGGYTCWYGEGNACWEYLTFSGEFFEGGSCEEEEATEEPQPEPTSPQPSQPETTQTPAPTQQPQPGGTTEPTPSESSLPALIPYQEIVGEWKGNGSIKFFGSQYCDTYTIPWTAGVDRSGVGTAQGTVFDSTFEVVATLKFTWDAAGNTWDINFISESFEDVSLAYVAATKTVEGSLTILAHALPCPDIGVEDQEGSFSGSRI